MSYWEPIAYVNFRHDKIRRLIFLTRSHHPIAVVLVLKFSCEENEAFLIKFLPMRTVILFFIASIISQIGMAQANKGTMSVTINNETAAPVEGITVELLRGRDSVVVKTSLTDKSGVATIENIPLGQYRVRTSGIGFSVVYSPLFLLDEQQNHYTVAPLSIARVATSMQGVTVSAKKPFVQRLNDRLVVNVESSIVGAGSSALDVLELSPGVTVDQNDAISLRGRSGVIIMIDGKISPMSGADLANYLKSLPANAIDRIEIITNPSAKYDAAGNSGIIDIRMKKDQRKGTNGTLNAGYGQGIYPKANAGGTFNYRNASMNIFGNYNYNYRKSLNHLMINRNFFNNGVSQGSDDKDNYAVMPMKGQSLRFGADFFLSSKAILGFVVNSNFNHFRRRADITTMVRDEMNQPDFSFLSIGTNNDRSNNSVANINYKHKFDSAGRELTADVDYGYYTSRSVTRTASQFFELNGTPKSEDDILDGDQLGNLTFKTGKVDYTNPLRNGSRFEIGYKASYVSSDNNARFYNVFPSGGVVDDTKTNRFFYEEYNNAGYINYNKDFKKLSVQLGLRGEQTNVKTHQVKNDKRFSNDYFKFFPSAFINYKLKPDQTIGVSLSRRIDRPGYSQLNPFLFQIDATIYSTGEPHLKPQLTWSSELNYTIKNLNFALNYSYTKDPQNLVLSRILDVIPDFEIKPGQDSNITVQIPVNLTASSYFGFTANAPIRINKWWNTMNNLNLFVNHFNGNLGGVGLNDGQLAANIRTSNTFSFKKGWSAELNANLATGGRYGYNVSKPQWGLAVGAQKNIMEGKGTIRLNVTDIFWTNLPKATVTYEGRYVENWHAKRETRVANLSFTYRFGSNKVQGARNRKTASEEERQRAGN
jgi:iron complex outermembrane recepter protein